MEGAKQLKEQGNAAYYNSEYGEAVNKYAMAISVFRYLANSNDNWRNKGILDEDITEIYYRGENGDEKDSISSFLLSCYGNLALVSLKCRQYKTTIAACNESLKINPQCVKALYLRSRAEIEPPSAGAVEEEKALADLVNANRIDPSNVPVRTMLSRLRESYSKQKAKDMSTFSGMFHRGLIYPDREKPCADNQGRRADGSSRNTCTPVAQAKAFVEILAAGGMDEEAYDMRQVVEKASSLQTIGTINFRNPTQAMMKDAERRGVDLSDDRVVAMLENLQQSRRDTVTRGTSLSVASVDASTTTSPPLPILGHVSRLFRLLNVEPRHFGLGFIAYVAMQVIRHWK